MVKARLQHPPLIIISDCIRFYPAWLLGFTESLPTGYFTATKRVTKKLYEITQDP